MIIITFEEIEERYKKTLLLDKSWIEKNKELNLLIMELQRSHLIPLMASEISHDFRRTREFKMYIKLSNLRSTNLDSIGGSL